jgi:hypothetical protein
MSRVEMIESALDRLDSYPEAVAGVCLTRMNDSAIDFLASLSEADFNAVEEADGALFPTTFIDSPAREVRVISFLCGLICTMRQAKRLAEMLAEGDPP